MVDLRSVIITFFPSKFSILELRLFYTASTLEKDLRAKVKSGSNIEAAKIVGQQIAARLKEKGITTVVFDRNGYVYHGRVKALADSAREAGLKF